MKKLVVLGNSPAAVKAIDLIREKSADIDITIISHDGGYPYRRDLFMDMLAKKVSTEDIFCHNRKYYKTKNIDVVTDLKVSRVNLKTRKIYTEQKKQFDFDYLILAELPEGAKLTEIKGGNKEGIYSLRKIQHVDKLIKEMPFFETVAIQSDTFAGLQQAQMLASAGKEVYLVVPTQSPVARIKNDDLKNVFQETLNQNNVFIIEENTIEEILGDAQVKAVRLSSGKVIGVDLVVQGEIYEDLKMIEEFDVNTQDGRLLVDECGRTNIDGVFAVDAMCAHQAHQWWGDFAATRFLEEEGRSVAAAIIDDVPAAETCVVEQSVTIGEKTIDFVYRNTDGQPTERSFYTNMDGLGSIEAISADGVIVGAYIVNAPVQKEAIKPFIFNGDTTDALVTSLKWQAVTQNTNTDDANLADSQEVEEIEKSEPATG